MPLADKTVSSMKGVDVFPDFSVSSSLIVLMCLAQLVVIIDFLFSKGLIIDWEYLGLATFYVQWQALISALLLSWLTKTLKRCDAAQAMIVVYGALLVLACGLSVFAQLLIPRVMLQDTPFFDWSFVIRNTLLSAIIMGVALHYLYLQRRLIMQHKAEAHAQLMTLQAKIKPHFLFNCLNSIAQLIHKQPEKAEDMVVDLSELLRASLQEGMVETTIKNEWQLCEHYLDIESNRLQGRLGWACDFSGLDTSLGILSLSLQPLIENAIYHGIQPNPQGGQVTIFGDSQEGAVTLIVENSQREHADTHHQTAGHQMALKNIRQRLLTLYGRRASLKQESLKASYRVTLQYDLKERAL